MEHPQADPQLSGLEHLVTSALHHLEGLGYSARTRRDYERAWAGPIGSVPAGIIGLVVHDTLAFSVAGTPLGVLSEHVELEVECIDRMYLNVYVPQLQHGKGVVGFFRFHRGHTFASSALMK